MPYTPTNHPYIPGDPYSYDLKWLVQEQKAAKALAQSADSKADQAISKANSADSKADTAIATANSASSAASGAVTTANEASSAAGNAVTTANAASSAATEALSKANQALNAVPTVIDIECEGGTATMNTDYTYAEIAELVRANKIYFRVAEVGALAASPLLFPRLWEYSGQDRILITYINTDMLGAGTPQYLYAKEAYFENSKTGIYRQGYVALTTVPL